MDAPFCYSPSCLDGKFLHNSMRTKKPDLKAVQQMVYENSNFLKFWTNQKVPSRRMVLCLNFSLETWIGNSGNLVVNSPCHG